jgi:TetR/AcrR family transcriptional regulator, repressor for neighboring sulfatase
MAKSAGPATSRFCSTADNGNRSAILHNDQMTNQPADVSAKPTGRDSVKHALIDATIELIIEQGTAVSVREIAIRADVNHGLIHTYFGSKEALIIAAVDAVSQRASSGIDKTGFPRPDLARQRAGELAKIIARMRLDGNRDLFTSHPVSDRWVAAIQENHDDVDELEAMTMVATASALALGWPVFANHICEVLKLDNDQRAVINDRIDALVAELGGIPD